VSEIDKGTSLSYERTYHYLKELEDTGAISSEKKGRNREYIVNKDHEITLKSFGILEMEKRQNFLEENPGIGTILLKLKQRILEGTKDYIKFIILYGSTAREQAKKESDIDILAVTISSPESMDPEKEMEEIQEQMNSTIPEETSIHIQDTSINEFRERWEKEPIYTSIWEDRILLYGEESFWEEVLKIGEPE